MSKHAGISLHAQGFVAQVVPTNTKNNYKINMAICAHIMCCVVRASLCYWGDVYVCTPTYSVGLPAKLEEEVRGKELSFCPTAD